MATIPWFLCLVPLICGVLALLDRSGRRLKPLIWAGTGVMLLLATDVVLAPGGEAAGDVLVASDPLARVMVAIVAVVGALSSAESFHYWHDDLVSAGGSHGQGGRGLPRVRLYFFWQQAFLASLLLAAVSGNLGLSWVAIELTTVTSAVLVGFSGEARAVEAAWKYVVLCSVGLALALFTTILLYALAGGGGIHVLDWRFLQQAAHGFPAGPAKLAFLFALVGFGTKCGLAPLHTWLPDAHSEAPAPISALLSGVLLAVVLCTLVRVAGVTAGATGVAFPFHLLLGAGLVTVAVATPFLVFQEDLKRLLAYSTIEQVGLMTIGFGLHTPLAVAGAVLQLIVHALVKSSLFFAAGRVLRATGSQRLARLRALGRRAPLLGAVLLAGVLTLGGMPPFGMFFSELAIVQGALHAATAIGLGLLGILAVIFSGLAFYVARAVFGPRGAGQRTRTTLGAILILGVPLLCSILVGMWTPGPLARGITAAATTASAVGGQRA